MMTGDLTYLKVEESIKKKRENNMKSQNSDSQHDLQVARQIQNHLLSKPLHKKKISIQGYYHWQADLGGDMYYWQQKNDHEYGIFLFDVMGHGIASSMICMYLRSLLPGMKHIKDPKTIIKELNKHMIRFNQSIHSDIEFYVAVFYVAINTKRKTVEYINAGHPRGMMITKDYQYKFLEKGCLPIGITKDLIIHVGKIEYDGYFELLVYSDGINDFLGITKDHVLKKIQSYQHSPIEDSIFYHLVHDIKREIKSDDQSIIYIKVSP